GRMLEHYSLLKLLPITSELIHQMYKQLKQHPYGGFYMFNLPIFLIIDPDLIKTITVKDFEYFTDHRPIVPKEYGEDVWNNGLFSLQGQRWKEMRAKLSPAFTSSKMKTMFVLISECCKQLVVFLEECQQNISGSECNISKEGNMLVLELKEFFTRYTNDVIATTAFGIGVNSLKHPKNDFFVKGQEATGLKQWRFFALLAFPLMAMLKMRIISDKVTEFFRSLVLETMNTRDKQGIVRPDMLQLLMEAKKNSLQDENSNDKNQKTKLDDEDIIAQALLFFLAGFDTASTLLCFISYELAMHPDVQRKLQDEVDKSLEENGGKFTYEAVNNMKYLDMVVSETLRMYPPAGAVDRLCTKRYTLKADPPLEFFPGDNLFIPIYGLHLDPKYYDDPEKFDPERFSDENKHKIHPFAYLPFGVGPRSCIGNRFALMETKLVLVYMLSDFNLKPINKTPKTIRIIQKGFNMSIAGGFWMVCA
ncbi:hypothetical protein L9F63_009045, partial [Diploptera punctata]